MEHPRSYWPALLLFFLLIPLFLVCLNILHKDSLVSGPHFNKLRGDYQKADYAEDGFGVCSVSDVLQGYYVFGPKPPGRYNITLSVSAKTISPDSFVKAYVKKHGAVLAGFNLDSEAIETGKALTKKVRLPEFGRYSIHVEVHGEQPVCIDSFLIESRWLDLSQKHILVICIFSAVFAALFFILSQLYWQSAQVVNRYGWSILSILLVGHFFIVFYTPHFYTGDEPHYVFAANWFFEYGSFFQRGHDPAGFKWLHSIATPNGNHPHHGVLLSLLTVPFLPLGEPLSGRALIFSLWLVSILLMLFVLNRYGLDKRERFWVVLLFGFTMPGIFYSGSIYPEMLAFVLSLGVFYLLCCASVNVYIILLAVLLSFLGFLTGIKYVFLFLIIWSVCLLKSICSSTGKMHLFKIGLFGPIYIALISIYSKWYFGWSNFLDIGLASKKDPNRIINSGGVGSNIDFTWFSETIYKVVSKFVGQLFDPAVGLLFFNPLIMFSLTGLVLIYKSVSDSRRPLLYMYLVSLLFMVFYACSNSWGGTSPSGRYIVAASWGLLPATIYGLQHYRDNFDKLIISAYAAWTIMIGFMGLLVPGWQLSQVMGRGENLVLKYIIGHNTNLNWHFQSYYSAFKQGEPILFSVNMIIVVGYVLIVLRNFAISRGYLRRGRLPTRVR